MSWHDIYYGSNLSKDDVIKWKYLPRYWPFVGGIHRWPAPRPETRSFDVFCAWINGWVNDSEAGDLRRHHTHNDVTVMQLMTPAVPLTVSIMEVFVRMLIIYIQSSHLNTPWTCHKSHEYLYSCILDSCNHGKHGTGLRRITYLSHIQHLLFWNTDIA